MHSHQPYIDLTIPLFLNQELLHLNFLALFSSCRKSLLKVALPVTVWVPLANVPLVLKFSSPKDMEPPESVILPVERVIVPSIEASSSTVKSSVVVNCSADTVPDDVMVKSLAIYTSVISVPCQTPDERVPTASISLSFEWL